MDKERIALLALAAERREEMEVYDCAGSCEDPECGDVLCYYLKIVREIVDQISFTIPESSCMPSKACAETAAELAQGKPVLAAYLITAKEIAKAMGGLDREYIHCALMAELALKRAVTEYAAGFRQS